MSIAADAGDSLEGKVKLDGGKACFREEGDKEGAKTAVDM